jgi:hypothetical protein
LNVQSVVTTTTPSPDPAAFGQVSAVEAVFPNLYYLCAVAVNSADFGELDFAFRGVSVEDGQIVVRAALVDFEVDLLTGEWSEVYFRNVSSVLSSCEDLLAAVNAYHLALESYEHWYGVSWQRDREDANPTELWAHVSRFASLFPGFVA